MKRFVYCGRFVDRKGLVFLANTWKKVGEKHPDYELILIGSGNNQPDSSEKKLNAIAKNNKLITILPEMDDIKTELRDYDVFVFPSEREGLSNALLEAMAMEMPIIATNIGGNCELIEHDKTGLLFEVNDEASLLHAIDTIFNYPDLGKNARKKVIKGYSLNIVAKKYIDVYKQCQKSQ